MNAKEIRMPSMLKKGYTYTVKFDGNTYECVAYEFQGANGAICIGNAMLAGGTGGNNEPFFIILSNEER